MSVYLLVPKGTDTVVEVATSAALKTLLQLATPSTTDIRVAAWGISFEGVSPTAEPGLVELIDTAGGATVTAQTPEKWGSDDSPASLCVSGTAASGYNASAEGTITASRILDAQKIHPQTGYSIWFPESKYPKVKASRFLRIRSTFAITINGIPWILFVEPA